MTTQTLQRNKLDFSGQNIYAGFDVHLKSWKVTIMTDHVVHKTFSQPASPEALYSYLVKNFPGGIYHSAYEAGFCGYWIHNKLEALGVKSIVVNPADIPTTHKEKLQKEDQRDSRKIAKALKNNELTPIYIPKQKTFEDRSLVRMRATIVKETSKFKNRIKSFLYLHGIEYPERFFCSQTHWSKAFINWLEEIEFKEESGKKALMTLVNEVKHHRSNVLELNRFVRNLSNSEAYNKEAKLLRSVPGIGLITTMIILTELETMNRFSNIDHLCSYIGLVPSTFSSGEKEVTGNITPRGHGVLRRALIESAWVAVRIDPALMMCYHEYCIRMESNKAIIRIAKKLLSRIRYVLKNEEPYVFSMVKK